MKEKLKTSAIDNDFIIKTLKTYNISSPDEIDNPDTAKKILEEFKHV